MSGHRFVVGPQSDHVVVPNEDLGCFQHGHGTSGLGQLLTDIHFELGALMSRRCHPGRHWAGLQKQGELVRVVPDGGVVGRQADR